MDLNNTIKEAKVFLKEHYGEAGGTTCPCCGQHVQLYKYPLFATSAVALILLYKLDKQFPEEEFFQVKRFAEQNFKKVRSPHFAELRFWGLVRSADKKTDIANSSGFWAITDDGRKFVEGSISVKNYIYVYNNKFRGFGGGEININDALGEKFNYNEIRNG